MKNSIRRNERKTESSPTAESAPPTSEYDEAKANVDALFDRALPVLRVVMRLVVDAGTADPAIGIFEAEDGGLVVAHGPLADLAEVDPSLYREAVSHRRPGRVLVILVTKDDEAGFFPCVGVDDPAELVNARGGEG